ncbi:MAG TPA: FAD-binding oxidoreductase [Acidimicrobiales bacterium]|jgi:alkyldihydroxyacetonephosphate synthase|nr:FAD-binding oxidoreductase [Acidimicrobiales bacterium]
MAGRVPSWWGWGYEDAALTTAQRDKLAASVTGLFGDGQATLEPHDPPDPATLGLRPPRVTAPDALAHLCADDPNSRAGHTHGKAFRDVVRNLEGRLAHPPDLVARPTTEAEVVDLLDWCAADGIAAIPYGGGSSVVGGVEADVGDGYRGAVSIDLTTMDRVLEIDRTSRAARIQAGTLGPHLEDQLRPHDLTLRHFPQSFERSTLGGWLATRAGGHFATVYTHIDDLTESLRVVTPSGISESRRLPGSGAGPSPDRMFIGSEGSLGIITEAWMRLQDRPRWRAGTSVTFAALERGVEAVRSLAQAALFPTNCRLLDGTEAALSAGTTGVGALLVLGFESADHPVEPAMTRAVELCRDHGGLLPEPVRYSDAGAPGAPREDDATASREGAAGEWRNSFLRAPYTRDALASLGLVVDTFETAITWDRFGDLHQAVMSATAAALQDVCGGGVVSCRFTHVYPDGAAPYFTVYAPGRWGSLVDQWDDIKAAASDAVLAGGGTITHHHAVGRDHRRWYDEQRPDPFAAALRAAKGALDPTGVLNPGVLIDPLR